MSKQNGSVRPPILQELLKFPRFCQWDLRQNNGGRLTKVPDQSTLQIDACRPWSEVAHIERNGEHGVGFVLTGGLVQGKHRLLAIDVDACRNPRTGELTPWAKTIVDNLQTATEITPSGTGLRLWVVTDTDVSHLRAKVRVHDVAAPGVDKHPEIQLFGLGPAGYVTVTFNQLPGTPKEIREVDLSWLIDTFDFDEVETADHVVLPEGYGPTPSIEEIKVEVRSRSGGKQLLDAEWWVPFPKASASEAYFSLVVRVLKAARGDGPTALTFLLQETKWGQGLVENSADPGRYARREWVEQEVLRAANKSRATENAADVFSPLDDDDGSAPREETREADPFDLAWDAPPIDPTVIPPPRRYLLHRVIEGKVCGFGPMGIASLLSSAGGVGKTMLLLQLGVSIVTGRPWIGFEVDEAQRHKKVLMILAEEPRDEIERRLADITAHYELDALEQELVRSQLKVLPLAGIPCPLAIMGPDNQPVRTKRFKKLVTRLEQSDEDYGLVVLDPLARLFPMAESNNELATFGIQCLEKITLSAPGRPLVKLAHHSSKSARRFKDVDVRGVTGLEDAARWSLTLLMRQNGIVELKQAKANYSTRLDAATNLRHGAGGVLRLLSEEEQEQERKAQAEDELSEVERDAVLLVEAIREHGPTQSVALLGKRAGISKARAGLAVHHATEQGLLVREGPARERVYTLPGVRRTARKSLE